MEGAVQLVWLLLFVVAFWLLLIRPQRRRQRQVLELQGSVQVGDQVMLSAGFLGRVSAAIDDPAAGDLLLVELSPGVEVKVARGAVMRVVTPVAQPDEPVAPAEQVDGGDDEPRGA